MSPITRSQTNKIVESNHADFTSLFTNIKSLLNKSVIPNITTQERVICATEIYTLLNKEMMKHERFYKSNKFVLTVYNKTFELENQVNHDNYGVDKKLIKNLITELTTIRPVLEGLISNMTDNINYQSHLDLARFRIKTERNLNIKDINNKDQNSKDQNTKDQSQRPKRNIKPIHYSGRDMSDEDEGKINVYKPWFENGKVIEKCSKRLLCQVNDLDDEDYVFEEDEDEDDDEDYEAEDDYVAEIY